MGDETEFCCVSEAMEHFRPQYPKPYTNGDLRRIVRRMVEEGKIKITGHCP